jgi:hypothetical protein
MARNGGPRFNRYKQFEFSIPPNYGRLEPHVERVRQTAQVEFESGGDLMLGVTERLVCE